MIEITLEREKLMRIVQFIDALIYQEIEKVVPEEMRKSVILKNREEIQEIMKRKKVSITL